MQIDSINVLLAYAICTAAAAFVLGVAFVISSSRARYWKILARKYKDELDSLGCEWETVKVMLPSDVISQVEQARLYSWGSRPASGIMGNREVRGA